MGLDEAYMPIRTQILSMVPRPKIQQVYGILIQEEDSQNTPKRSSFPEMSALYLSQNKRSPSITSEQQPNKGYRKDLFCNYCKMPGHTREFCYKLNGYPPGHKLHKGTSTYNNRGNKAIANNVTVIDDSTGQLHETNQNLQLDSLRINQQQIDKLIAMLDLPDKMVNHVAGTTPLVPVSNENIEWLIDSGSTDHITSHKNILKDIKPVTEPYSVSLPNGHRTTVTHTGSYVLNNYLTLKGVLLIPCIKYNLISVAKLARDSQVSFIFTDETCTIQDHARKQLCGLVNASTTYIPLRAKQMELVFQHNIIKIVSLYGTNVWDMSLFQK